MRQHSLPDAAFAALGAGRPDRLTLAELRAAQRGRHLLLVREIVRAGSGDTDRWYAHLAANPHLLADPLFGAWAAHHLKARAGCPPAMFPKREPADPPRVLAAGRDGLDLRVRLEDTDPRRALLGLRPTGRLSDAEAAHWQDRLTEAWRLLVTRHRPQAEILAAVLDCVVPVEPDAATRGISATSADAFGAVAMSAPGDGVSLAVGLLHEAQHSILNATQYLFDLHERPGALGYSPWRDDPRPASGLLHGAYAYLAVTRFWRAEAAATGDRLAGFEFARWREAVADVTHRLLDGDRDGNGGERDSGNGNGGKAGGGEGSGLTAAGARFVTALRDEVQPWLAEPVDPDVQRLARAANTDHRLRWRLRNLVVDPADAAAVAAAWRHGDRPPPVASRLVPAPRRALESSARLDLVHRALRGDPQPGGRATAGDTAFVRGDYGTARRAYRNGVDWTGLALTGPIRGRLEVIVSAYRLLGERPDPLAFADWMST
jgi:hypothetical protein